MQPVSSAHCTSVWAYSSCVTAGDLVLTPGKSCLPSICLWNLLANHRRISHWDWHVWGQVPDRRCVSPRDDRMIKMYDGKGLTIIPSLMNKEANAVRVPVLGVGEAIPDRWLMPRASNQAGSAKRNGQVWMRFLWQCITSPTLGLWFGNYYRKRSEMTIFFLILNTCMFKRILTLLSNLNLECSLKPRPSRLLWSMTLEKVVEMLKFGQWWEVLGHFGT